MKQIRFPILLVIPMLFTGCAQVYHRQADIAFGNMAYEKAIRYYEAALSKKEIAAARINLAHAYRLANDPQKAEVEYRKVNELPESEPENWYYLAKMLMMNNKHDEAKRWLDSYLAVRPQDSLAQSVCRSCDKARMLSKDTALFTITQLKIEGMSSAFAPVMYKNGIVFCGNKEVGRGVQKDPWTGKSYLNLYYSEKGDSGRWITPVVLQGDINTNYHEGPATFNAEGRLIFFTRSNYNGKRLGKDKSNINNLKLFHAVLNNERWTAPQEAPFNNDSYSTGHPSLSQDGKKLYFISDMPGGYGGTDIYECSVVDGELSAPRNLGPSINTPGNEMFPWHSSADSALYFASEGHENFGGLDIFRTSYTGAGWSKPINIGYPFNTSMDDFAYTQAADSSSGFFSSNRSGADQLYEFKKNEPEIPVFYVAGIVMESRKVPLPNATVTAVEVQGNVVTTVLTDSAGMYSMMLEAGKEYKLFTRKDMYFTKTIVIPASSNGLVRADLTVDKIEIEKPIVLDNIYYDKNKWSIRPDAAAELDKLVVILKENPDIKIELGSHTDSWGDAKYNMMLSEKRARSAIDYIVSRGIEASRLTAKGYGESKPLHSCTRCTGLQDAQNRRTEFKVTRVGGNKEMVSSDK